MCRSAAEGGQRCPGGAKEALDAAKEAYRVAAMDYLEGRAPAQPHLDAMQAVWDARAEYASTDQGEAELSALADRWEQSGPTPDSERLRQTIARGREIRERNAAVLAAARRTAVRAALKDVAASRLAHVPANNPNRRWMVSTEANLLNDRYDAFLALAEADTSLKAPTGWLARQRKHHSSQHVSITGRAAGYALWRAQTTGAAFAPALPTGQTYVPTVTSWGDLRPGDVIDTPGHKRRGDVAHEGKVVATVTDADGARQRTITFTDGTSDTRGPQNVFTVHRPMTAEMEAAVARYRDISMRRAVTRGTDEHGQYVEDRDTGERAYAA